MKIVINDCYGGFRLTDKALEALGAEWSDRVSRTDPRLIKMVEKGANDIEESCAELAIVEIPDESTDWMIQEYEGAETVFYVLDGKIYQADYAEDEDEEE